MLYSLAAFGKSEHQVPTASANVWLPNQKLLLSDVGSLNIAVQSLSYTAQTALFALKTAFAELSPFRLEKIEQ